MKFSIATITFYDDRKGLLTRSIPQNLCTTHDLSPLNITVYPFLRTFTDKISFNKTEIGLISQPKVKIKKNWKKVFRPCFVLSTLKILRKTYFVIYEKSRGQKWLEKRIITRHLLHSNNKAFRFLCERLPVLTASDLRLVSIT